MILHLYFARRFLKAFGATFGVFFALTFLLNLVEEIGRFGPDVLSFAGAIELTLLSVPRSLYQITPLIMILATLILYLGLARSSEMVVTRASGRSAMRALVSPFAASLLVGALLVGVFNPIVASTSKRYEVLKSTYKAGEFSVFSISDEGLWLRQGDQTGQTVIRATTASADGSILRNVTFFSLDDVGNPTQRIEARQATLEQNRWVLTKAKVWPLARGQNPEDNAQLMDRITVQTDLTRQGIADTFGDPLVVPVWQLPAYIADLERAGFSGRRHAVWFYMELSRPLFLAAMVLVGAAFTMRHTRFGRTGLMVLMAVLMAFGLYFMRNFAQILGENGQLPLQLAIWAPLVAAMLLPLGLILHLEDG